MNRIYKFTAINKLNRSERCGARNGTRGVRSVVRHPPPATRHSPPAWFLVGLLIPFLLSCASVRPVVKIGLIAPFEGLYRRTGYDALSAMRAAISASRSSLDLLPLALDDSNDSLRAHRTAQKLLLDQQVRAVIGPVTSATIASVAGVIEQTPVLWLAPGMVTSEGFMPPRAHQTALIELIRAVTPVMRQQGAQRLALAGWPGQTPFSLDSKIELPGVFVTQPAEVAATDAVFWLGDAVAGATFLTQLRQTQPAVPFWLGLQGEDPVFTAFTAVRTGIYWAAWADSGYDQWAQTHSPATLLAYQVYLATQQAIAQFADPSEQSQGSWSIRLFVLQSDGSSQPLLPE